MDEEYMRKVTVFEESRCECGERTVTWDDPVAEGVWVQHGHFQTRRFFPNVTLTDDNFLLRRRAWLQELDAEP